MRRYLLLSAIGLLLLGMGCIKEYPAADTLTSSLRLFPRPGAGVDDLSAVKWLDVFAFDSTRLLYGHWRYTAAQWSETGAVEVPLAFGRYRIVVWGDAGEEYCFTPAFAVGKTRLDEMYLQVSYDEEPVTSLTAAVLFGYSPFEVTIAAGRQTELNLPLKQQTHLVHVRTRGLYPDPASRYELRVDDDVDGYFFDGQPHVDPMTYRIPCTADEDGQPYASVRLPSLAGKRASPLFGLYNKSTGEKLFEDELTKLLLLLRDNNVPVDFETMHEFEIVLSFDAAEATVSVFVNGWVVIEYSGPIYG